MLVDCVMFGWEIEVLEGRLYTLGPHVDHFIITESDHFFQNQPKGYVLPQHWGRLLEFRDKITYIPVKSDLSEDPWDNEIQQRRAAEPVLQSMGLNSDDVITVCDVDEWWDPAQFPDEREVVAFNMAKYHMSLHWYHKHELTGVGGRWSYFNGKNLDHERRGMRHTFPAITGGAHFTTMGDFDSALRKMQGFAHSEFNSPQLELEMRNFWGTGRFYNDVFQEVEFDENTPAWVTDRRFPESWYRRRDGSP